MHLESCETLVAKEGEEGHRQNLLVEWVLATEESNQNYYVWDWLGDGRQEAKLRIKTWLNGRLSFTMQLNIT